MFATDEYTLPLAALIENGSTSSPDRRNDRRFVMQAVRAALTSMLKSIAISMTALAIAVRLFIVGS